MRDLPRVPPKIGLPISGVAPRAPQGRGVVDGAARRADARDVTAAPKNAADLHVPSVATDVVASRTAVVSGGSGIDVRLGNVPVLSRGPVADYEKASGVWLHQFLRDSPYARTLVDELGMNVGFQLRDRDVSASDPAEFWMQDYAPKRVRRGDGSLKLVGYLSPNEKRSGVMGGTLQNPMRPELTFHPAPYQPVASNGPQRGAWCAHERLSLVMEGGNIVCANGRVFISEKVISDNAKDWKRAGVKHLERQGFQVRGREEIVKMIAAAMEVGVDAVTILPSMPSERTRHVDMFLLPLGDNVIAVPEIRSDAFDVVGYEHERALGDRVKQHLNDIAGRLIALGFVVERPPMLPPIHLKDESDVVGGVGALVATPTQTTLFDVDGKRRAFVPTLSYDGFGEAYQAKAAAYRDAWTEMLARAGWQTRTYDAADLFDKKGGGHCVSTSAP